MYMHIQCILDSCRHEIDGSKEHITMKLSLAQRGEERKTKKSKVKKEEVKEVMEDDYSDNDRSGDDDYGM